MRAEEGLADSSHPLIRLLLIAYRFSTKESSQKRRMNSVSISILYHFVVDRNRITPWKRNQWFNHSESYCVSNYMKIFRDSKIRLLEHYLTQYPSNYPTNLQ